MNIAFYLLVSFLAFVYFEPSLFLPILGKIRAALLLGLLAFVMSFLAGARPSKAIQNRLFLFLFVLALVGLLVSPFPYGDDNQDHFSHFYKAIAFYFLVSMIIVRKDYLIKYFYINLTLGFLVCFFSILTVRSGIEPLKGGDLYRMVNYFGGIGDDPNELGATLLALLPLPLCMIKNQKTWLKKGLFTVIAMTFLLGIFRTRSRGCFVGLIIVTAFLIWEYRRNISVLSIVLVMIAFAALHTHYGYWERLLRLKTIEEDYPAYSRVLQTKYALRLMELRPLTGVGLGNFTRGKIKMLDIEDEKLASMAAHNAYLGFGAEVGIVGLVIFVLIIVNSIYYCHVAERFFATSSEYAHLEAISRGIRIGLIGLAFSIFFLSEQYNLILYQWIAFSVALKVVADKERNRQLAR